MCVACLRSPLVWYRIMNLISFLFQMFIVKFAYIRKEKMKTHFVTLITVKSPNLLNMFYVLYFTCHLRAPLCVLRMHKISTLLYEMSDFSFDFSG